MWLNDVRTLVLITSVFSFQWECCCQVLFSVCVCVFYFTHSNLYQSGFLFRFNEIENTDTRYTNINAYQFNIFIVSGTEILVKYILILKISKLIKLLVKMKINNDLCSKKDFQIYLLMFHFVVLSLCSLSWKHFYSNWLKKELYCL